MAYAAPLGEQASELRGSPLRRLVGGLVTVLGLGVSVGTLLVLLADAVTEDTSRRATAAAAEPATISLPYGGQLERPDPGDLIEPGGLMGLGLLALGLTNGLVFAFAAALDGTRGPSAAETRRRLRNRHGRGAVPGGRREVARTVVVPAAAPAASAGPLGVVEAGDLPARRSAPGRAAPGTTYAPIPAPRRSEPERHPEPERLQARMPIPAPETAPEPAPEPTPEPEPRAEPARAEELVPEPTEELTEDPAEEPAEEPEVPEPVADDVPASRAPRRPSPVPRDGGDGRPSPATRRGTGPWGWRPARPDPVPWRNPRPWPALTGAH